MKGTQQHTLLEVHRVGTWDWFSRASITAGVTFSGFVRMFSVHGRQFVMTALSSRFCQVAVSC